MQRSENPLLQAICDRILLDSANVEYLVDVVPAQALQRQLPGGWTAGRVLVHLAGTNRWRAEALAGVRRGEPLDPHSSPAASAAAADSRTTTDLPVDELIEEFRRSRRVFLEAIHLLPERLLGDTDHGPHLLATLDAWSRHYAEHALEIVMIVPEIQVDQFVLTWLLHADFSANSERLENQRKLYEHAIAANAAHQPGVPTEEPDAP